MLLYDLCHYGGIHPSRRSSHVPLYEHASRFRPHRICNTLPVGMYLLRNVCFVYGALSRERHAHCGIHLAAFPFPCGSIVATERHTRLLAVRSLPLPKYLWNTRLHKNELYGSHSSRHSSRIPSTMGTGRCLFPPCLYSISLADNTCPPTCYRGREGKTTYFTSTILVAGCSLFLRLTTVTTDWARFINASPVMLSLSVAAGFPLSPLSQIP